VCRERDDHQTNLYKIFCSTFIYIVQHSNQHTIRKMEEFNNRIVINPNDLWYIKSNDSLIDFPPLHYYMVKQLNVPEKTLVLGGSHNAYAQLPMYLTRCEIFEQNYMPYTLNTPHFKVRNAVLLWSRLNLYSYTDMMNPQTVYIKKNNVFIAKFIFDSAKIELHEIVVVSS